MIKQQNYPNVAKLGIGYVRCSTDMQEQSPEQQMKEMKR